MQTVILTIHIILAVALTILVLLQRSEGGALGALGGGQGASGLFTGRQAGNLLTRMTVYLFIGFVATSLTLVIMAKQDMAEEKISIMPVAQEETVTDKVADEVAQEAQAIAQEVKEEAENVAQEVKEEVAEVAEEVKAVEATVEEKAQEAVQEAETIAQEIAPKTTPDRIEEPAQENAKAE